MSQVAPQRVLWRTTQKTLFVSLMFAPHEERNVTMLSLVQPHRFGARDHIQARPAPARRAEGEALGTVPSRWDAFEVAA